MATKGFTQDSLRDELAPIPQLASGADGWFLLGVAQIRTVMKALKNKGLSMAALSSYIDFVDLATDGMDEDDESLVLDKILLIRRKSNRIEQVSLPKISKSKTDPEAIVLQIGDTYVPVEQDGQSFKVGGLSSDDAFDLIPDQEGREGETEDDPRRYRHMLTLRDEESGATFEVLILSDNSQDVSARVLVNTLKKGNSIADLLAKPSSGGGGGLCVPMMEYVSEHGLEFPVELDVVGVRRIPSKAEWRKSKGGISWGLLLKGGGGVYARGGSEAYLDRNSDSIDGLLKQVGHMVLQITGTSTTKSGKEVVENQLLMPVDAFAELDGLLLSGSAPASKELAPAKAKKAAAPAPEPEADEDDEEEVVVAASTIKKAPARNKARREPVAVGASSDDSDRAGLLADLDI